MDMNKLDIYFTGLTDVLWSIERRLGDIASSIDGLPIDLLPIPVPIRIEQATKMAAFVTPEEGAALLNAAAEQDEEEERMSL